MKGIMLSSLPLQCLMEPLWVPVEPAGLALPFSQGRLSQLLLKNSPVQTHLDPSMAPCGDSALQPLAWHVQQRPG